MKNSTFSTVACILSVVSVVLAVLDAGSIGVWLSASTWLLIAVILGIWAIYTKE